MGAASPHQSNHVLSRGGTVFLVAVVSAIIFAVAPRAVVHASHVVALESAHAGRLAGLEFVECLRRGGFKASRCYPNTSQFTPGNKRQNIVVSLF